MDILKGSEGDGHSHGHGNDPTMSSGYGDSAGVGGGGVVGDEPALSAEEIAKVERDIALKKEEDEFEKLEQQFLVDFGLAEAPVE